MCWDSFGSVSCMHVILHIRYATCRNVWEDISIHASVGAPTVDGCPSRSCDVVLRDPI